MISPTLFSQKTMTPTDPYNVAFQDWETGGFRHSQHPFLQLACVITEGPPNFKEISIFSTSIRPTNKLLITPEALAVNKLNPEWLKEFAPYARHVAVAFAAFLNTSRLPLRFGGHNCPFDHDFSVLLLSLANIKPIWNPDPSTYCDTLSDARAYLKLENNKLGTVCEHLGVKLSNAHSALPDTRAVIKCARKIYKIKTQVTV